MENQEPILVLQKNADKTLNKIVLPKVYVNEWGRTFLMKIYKDGTMIIKPIEKGE